TALRRADRRAGRGRSSGLSALVVVEITIAAVLLINGSLIVQSFTRLQRVDLGFDPRRLLAMELTPAPARYVTRLARARLGERGRASRRAIPGAPGAGVSPNTPLQDLSFDSVFTVDGRPPANPADVPITAHRVVTPGYLQALGARLVRGRFLDEHDRED